jgi:hypothetical protein
LLKKSQIKTAAGSKMMRVIVDNRVSFDNSKDDVIVNLDCSFSNADVLQCKSQINNLVSDSIATLHNVLAPMAKIQAVLSANLYFVIEEKQLKNISFKVESDEGEFEFADFFGKKMQVRNFSLEGEYDNKALGQLPNDKPWYCYQFFKPRVIN